MWGVLSNRVGGSEAVQVAAERALLAPIRDGGLKEATAAQLEEGGQVPHDPQAVEGEQRVTVCSHYLRQSTDLIDFACGRSRNVLWVCLSSRRLCKYTTEPLLGLSNEIVFVIQPHVEKIAGVMRHPGSDMNIFRLHFCVPSQ